MVDQLNPATDQAVATAEPVVAAPAVEVQTPAAAPVAEQPPAPQERIPVNAAAIAARQLEREQPNPVRVIKPRADGALPDNLEKGKFIVAPAPQQPNAPPSQEEHIAPAPTATTEAPANGVVVTADPLPATASPASWEQLTGGQIKTQADWETFQSERQQLAEQVRTLTESRVDFANPLVAKLNEVFKNGGDIATVASVIKAQELDPTSMKPLEAIKASISFQHPNLDAEEVEAHIESLGINLSDMEGAGTRAALKVQSEKASQYLNSLKVQMDNPQVLVAAQEAAAERTRNEELWKTVPPPPISTKINQNVDGVVVATDFAYSPEALAFATQTTAGMRTLPKNEQNTQNYLELHGMFARAYDSERLIAQVAKEAVRVAKLEAAKATAGPTPTPVVQAPSPQPAQSRPKGHFALGGS